MANAKVMVGVYAGLIPNQPEKEYTREYVLTDEQWAAARRGEVSTEAELLAELNGKAQGYAFWLMMQPQHINWVRTDWIWL